MNKILGVIFLSLVLSGNAYAEDWTPLLEKKENEMTMSFSCVDHFDDDKRVDYGFTLIDGGWYLHRWRGESFANASFMLIPLDNNALNFIWPTSTGFLEMNTFLFNSKEILSESNKNIEIERRFFKASNDIDIAKIKQLNSLMIKNLELKDPKKLNTQIVLLFNEIMDLYMRTRDNLQRVGGSKKYCIRDSLNNS